MKALWLLLAAVPAAGAGPEPGPTFRKLQGMAAMTESAPAAAEAAAEKAREGFDEPEPISPAVFAPLSPATPAEPSAAPGLRRADYVVGRPERLSEPKNPLNSDGKLKLDKGKVTKFIGAGLLGILGGVVGFLLGGPVGAAIGAAVGAAAGYLISP